MIRMGGRSGMKGRREMSGMNKMKMRVTDMTKGDPVRLILAFAIPLLLGNVFQQVYQVVDTMVAGYHLGDRAIAAIGATSSLYALMIDFLSGLNQGYAIVVTQSFGAHDEKKIRQSVAGMIELNLAAALLLTLLSLLFLRPLMHFMNIPETVFEDAYRYLAAICAGMTATVCYNMFAGILRAVGNSRSALYFLIFSSVLNMGLDIFFVAVLDYGVAGAAIATVIAQTVSAVLGGGYVLRHYQPILPKAGDFRIPRELLSELSASGLAMGLMLCVVDLGSVIFQRANNHLGEGSISAHAASRRLLGILMQPLGTIATASATFIGQNWGAGEPGRIRIALKRVLCMEWLWAAFACAAVFAFGGAMVRLTTGTTDVMVIENAVMSLRWHLTFFPVLGTLLCLRTAMQAMGQRMIPVLSSCLELCMKILSAVWLIPRYGFLGTSITEPVTWSAMLLFLAVAYGACQAQMTTRGIQG